MHPPPPRPHHNEDPIAEGSVKSVVFPEHAQVVPPPLTVVHPSTRYRQLVPTEADSRDEDEYDEYDEEEDSKCDRPELTSLERQLDVMKMLFKSP